MAGTSKGTKYTREEARTLVLTPGVLRVGMIVCEHGMRLLVEETPRRSRSHADDRTYWTEARVLNRDEVPSEWVPYSFTARPDGVHRWTLQGNELMTYTVEVDR